MIATRPPYLSTPTSPLPTEEALQSEARRRHEASEELLLPMRLREWRVPVLDREAILRGAESKRPTPALHHVRRFHQADTDWALVLWGGYRVGKTYAAIRWLVEAARVPMETLDHGRTFRYATSARFIPFADLADAAGSYRDHHQALVVEAVSARALVLDDVGAQLAAGASILDQVISARHLQQRPTLLTTNLRRDLFARPDRYGLRATLRLEERGSFHACGGDDERAALRDLSPVPSPKEGGGSSSDIFAKGHSQSTPRELSPPSLGEGTGGEVMSAPHDPQAERAVLGALLAQPSRIPDVASVLRSDDLFVEAHRVLFDAALECDARGIALDTLTMADFLRSRGQLTRVGGVAYLAELDTAAPTAANAMEYARIIADRGARRRALAILEPAARLLATELGDTTDLVAGVQLGLLEVEERRKEGDLKPFADSLLRTLDHLDHLREHRGGITGLATGYPELDRMLTGLHGGELVILAARPSVGKSALALNIAGHVALREKKPVALFSLEMPDDQLGLRLLSSEGRVSLKRLREGGLSDRDFTHLNDASANLHAAPLFVDDSGTLTPFEVRARCRRLKQRRPDLALVVVDYLQLMAGAGRTYSREQEVAQCSRALKQLAKELEVPVLALSQLNRKVEERKGGRPMLSDLRESGSLEQDADVVLFIHPEESSGDDAANDAQPGAVPVELIVAKQRNGPTGAVPLTLLQEWTRFESRARESASR